MRKHLSTVGVIATLLTPMMSIPTAAASDRYSNPKTFEEAMVGFAMKSRHLDADAAKKYLAEQKDQQQKLDELTHAGADIDGAYFDADNKLVVIADDKKSAEKIDDEGLRAKQGTGQEDMEKIARSIVSSFHGTKDVVSITPDLPSGKVKVAIAEDASDDVRDQLKHFGSQVSISTVKDAALQADVLAGQDMNMPFGDGSGKMAACSNGFMATLKNGNTVMLTAGHCVENKSRHVFDSKRHEIGHILDSQFRTGSAGHDMGLVDIDSDDTPYGWVDTRGFDGYFAVKGMSKNAVGTQLCKSGRTTGWTCGTIQGYDTTVNYGNGTSVSGLMTTTVCTEQGDSGGAYIGVGNLAQGLTSGGPVGQKCGGFNTAYAHQGTSYVEPIVDAAAYYKADLITAKQ